MLTTLYEKARVTGPSVLTPDLNRFYGDLAFPEVSGRPYVVGNFVKTVDGPVTFGKGVANPLFGSREDRLVMSILRALADAVVVGKDTLLDDPPSATWHWKTTISPDKRDMLLEFAKRLGKRKLQKNVFVSATGTGFDFSRNVFHDSDVNAVIATTAVGAGHLKQEISALAEPPSLEIWPLDDSGGGVDLGNLIAKLWQEDSRFVLLEGGAALYGSFEALDLVDEIFLSQHPMIAGNGKSAPRPTFSGSSYPAGGQKRVTLVSIKKGENDTLFFRWHYRRE